MCVSVFWLPSVVGSHGACRRTFFNFWIIISCSSQFPVPASCPANVLARFVCLLVWKAASLMGSGQRSNSLFTATDGIGSSSVHAGVHAPMFILHLPAMITVTWTRKKHLKCWFYSTILMCATVNGSTKSLELQYQKICLGGASELDIAWILTGVKQKRSVFIESNCLTFFLASHLSYFEWFLYEEYVSVWI